MCILWQYICYDKYFKQSNKLSHILDIKNTCVYTYLCSSIKPFCSDGFTGNIENSYSPKWNYSF